MCKVKAEVALGKFLAGDWGQNVTTGSGSKDITC